MASKYAGLVQNELRDLRGNAMVGAVVRVYLTGTFTLATLYDNPVEIATAGAGDALLNHEITGLPAAAGLLQPGIDTGANYTFYADSDQDYDLYVTWQGDTFIYRVRPNLFSPGGLGSGGLASITAANGTIVIGGTATDPTVAVGTGVPQSAITNLTTDLAAKAPLASPTFTGTVTLPTTIAPGAGGANSLQMGPSATAAGTGGTAYGSAAKADGSNGVAIGFDARATFDFCVAVGNSSRANVATTCTAVGHAASATGGSGASSFGYSAIASGAFSVAMGGTAAGSQSVTLGRVASVAAGETGGIAIGYQAVVGGGPTPGGENVAVGKQASAPNWRNSAFGFKAQCHAVSATAMGRGAIAYTSHSIALGRGSVTDPAGNEQQVAIGQSSGAAHLWLNSGWAHRYWDDVDAVDVNNLPSTRPIVIHGCDALDARGRSVSDAVTNSTTTVTSATARFTTNDVGKFISGGSIPAGATIAAYVSPTQITLSAAATASATGVTITIAAVSPWTADTNIAGGPLRLAGGVGTGTAAGGSVALQVAPAGGASNNTKNALVNVVEAGVVGTARALGFFGAAPVVKPTGVTVDAAGIHAALVSLGLIAA